MRITPPHGAFRGFGAPQTEFAAETQVNRIAERLNLSPLALRRSWVYREGGVTPTGQVLRESVAGTEVLEAAAQASEYEGVAGHTRRAREQRGEDASTARGIGLALAWHGAGFTGSGEVHLASVASLELTADGEIRILTASTEMGQGTKTIFPSSWPRRWGWSRSRSRSRRRTLHRPRLGPTTRPGRPWSSAAADQGGRTDADPGGGGHRRLPDTHRSFAKSRGALRVDEQFTPYPGVTFDDTTYTGDAYPCFGWAAAVAEVEVDLDTGEVAVTDVVSADEIGRVIHQVLAEGQVEGGSLQAVGYATIEELKLVDGRYLNDRLATYLIPTAMDAPRITSLCRAP
jgi:CO/xanthine dehydrogenase Mo-binding subunit